MPVATQDGKTVLKGERRNPRVVGRNRPAGALEHHAQSRVGARRRFGDRKELEIFQIRIEPSFVGRAMPGLGDAVPEFAQDDDRYRDPRLHAKDAADTRIAAHECGKRIRVDYHARSSGSITSKAWSIRAWILAVSPR